MEKRTLSELFDHLKNINLSNPDACEEIDSIRKDFFKVDRKLIDCEPRICDSVWEITDGRSSINYKGAHYEMFLQRSESNKLLVTFDGARTSNGGDIRKIPYFPRWSWYPYINANFLCIEDPMYYRYEKLKLGWFYGTEKENFIQYTAEIILAIANRFEISIDNIILYGSSGGGTAAILIGAVLKGVKVIALNAQVELSNFSYAKKFEAITGIDLTNKDSFFRNDTKYMIDNAPNTSFYLLYNIRSEEDIKFQAEILAKKMGIKLRYGISHQKNLTIWVYDAQSERSHTALEDYIIFYLIRFYVDHNDLVTKNYDAFVNEIWRNINELREIKKELSYKKNYYNVVKSNNNMENDLYKDAITIEAIGNYSHRIIVDSLESGSLYFLHVKKIKVYQCLNEVKVISIAIYDFENNTIDKIFNLIKDDDIKICFETKNTCKKLSLLLYCGEIGKTYGNILMFEGISLMKIGYLC